MFDGRRDKTLTIPQADDFKELKSVFPCRFNVSLPQTSSREDRVIVHTQLKQFNAMD